MLCPYSPWAAINFTSTRTMSQCLEGNYVPLLCKENPESPEQGHPTSSAFPGRPVTLAIGANPVLSASLFWEACLLLQYGAEKCEHFNLLSHGDKIMSSNLRACCRSFPIHRKSQSQDGLFLRKQVLMSCRSVSFYLWTPCNRSLPYKPLILKFEIKLK